MTLTLNIPDPLQQRLEAVCTDSPRAVLEGFAVEAYRTCTLSRAEVGQLLEHASLWDTESLLSQHDAWPAPTFDEFAEDINGLGKVPEPLQSSVTPRFCTI